MPFHNDVITPVRTGRSHNPAEWNRTAEQGPTSMRIACWQTVAGGEPPRTRLRAAARGAADAGAQLLITPEISLTGYHLGPRRLRELAEPDDGPMCDEAAAIAAETGVAIVFGWPEAADGAVYN